jgi:succinyl-CoA synthetase alpha subunit
LSGTNVVGGVTPGKGGLPSRPPSFNTVKTPLNKLVLTPIIFVPPAFAADAIMEAADAG